MNNAYDKNTFQNLTPEINREKVCPFLLRVFYRENDYNSLEDFENLTLPTNREFHIYTWMDATLREITMLIKEAINSGRKKDVQLIFSLIFPDSKGKLQRKELGSIYSNRKSSDDTKTLQNLRFSIGDYLDICIVNKN